MGEYEHIADPGKEQRPPGAAGSEARAPFRPPKLVSSTCFTDYEVRHRPLLCVQSSLWWFRAHDIPWSDHAVVHNDSFSAHKQTKFLLNSQSRGHLSKSPGQACVSKACHRH